MRSLMLAILLTTAGAAEGPLADWRVLRDAAAVAPPPADAPWVERDADLLRVRRADAVEGERGLPIWLAHEIVATEADRKGHWIVSVPNQRVVLGAWLDGTALATIHHDRPGLARTPAVERIIAGHRFDGGSGLVGDAGVGDRRREAEETAGQRPDLPALLLVPGELLRPGSNRLTLRVLDYDHRGRLLGDVALRRPTLADRCVVHSFSRPLGASGTETVLRIHQRVPGSLQAALDLRLEAYDGRVLEERSETLQLSGDSAELVLTDRQPVYKVVATLRHGEEALEPHWAYRRHRLEQRGERVRFSLEGEWELGSLKQGSWPDAPPSEAGWTPTWVPGVQKGQWQYKLEDELVLRHRFACPEAIAAGGRVALELEGVAFLARIWLNGQDLGEVGFHQSPATIELGDALVRDGDNELVIQLGSIADFARRHTTSARDTMAQMLMGRSMGLGGVALVARPALRVERQRVATTADGGIEVEHVVVNHGSQPAELALGGVVTLRGERVVALEPQRVDVAPGAESVVTSRAQVADPALWSPWDPQLHLLTTELRRDDAVVDRRELRFGWREIAIRGHDILVNGRVVHAHGGISEFHGWPLLDGDHLAAELRARRAGGELFDRCATAALRFQHRIYDEIGMLTAQHVGPWVNGAGRRQVGLDDETAQIYAVQARNLIQANAHHPSILLWNHGNEVVCGGFTLDQELAEAMARVTSAISAADPTRPVTTDGSYDLLGRIGIINPHYPFDVDFLGYRVEDLPAPWRERTRMGTGWDYSARRMGACSWDRAKPLYSSEFSWVKKFQPGEGVETLGDAARKPTPQLAAEGEQVSALMAEAEERYREILAYRHNEVAVSSAFHMPGLAPEAYAPVLATFADRSTRLWAGAPARRAVRLFNDAGDAREIAVRLVLDHAGARQVLAEERQRLAHGAQAAFDLAFEVPATDAPSLALARLQTVVDGAVVHEEAARWHLLPRSWLPDTAAVRVALIDPAGTSGALFGHVPAAVVRLADAGELASTGVDLVVVGEDAGAAFATAPNALIDHVRAGGRALVLRQSGEEPWIPAATAPQFERAYGTRAFTYAQHHAALAGLGDVDFDWWGRHGLVHGLRWRLPKQGRVRMLVGEGYDAPVLFESRLGAGAALVSALELTPATLAQEPAACRLLANVLRWGAAGEAQPARRTVVLAPVGGARAAALGKELGLVAERRQQLGDLGAVDLVVLCDWDDDAPALDGLGAWVRAGGSLLVQSPSPALQAALQSALGIGFDRRAVRGTAAYRVARHPLLGGIGDSHLRWYRINKRDPFDSAGGRYAPYLLLDQVVVPEGATLHTAPAVLTSRELGSGRLVVETSRWLEVSPDKDRSWSGDSRERARRFQAALLTTLGAELRVELDASSPLDRFRALAQHPLALGSAANRLLVDAAAGDGAGWLDLGPGNDFSGLEPGELDAAGFRFRIGERGTALRSAKHLPAAPPASEPIVVGRTAAALAFLHTAGFAGADKGTPGWRYEIRYEGFSSLIPGEDVEPFVARVPVRLGIDVDDWWTGAPRAPAVHSVAGDKGRLYLQLWENPRPDQRIESIVVRDPAGEVVPLLLALSVLSGDLVAASAEAGVVAAATRAAASVPAGDILEVGAWSGDGFPAGWTPAQGWMKGRFRQGELDGMPVLRVSERPAIISAEAAVPAGTQRVVLRSVVRVQDLRTGDRPWDTCSVTLTLLDAAGERVGKDANHWLRASTPFTPIELSLPVRGGTTRLRVTINHKAPQGDFALGPVSVVAE